MRTILTAVLLFLATGCSNELETGYKPQPIGVSDEERRAYYAPPFSPEAQAARQAAQSGLTTSAGKTVGITRPKGD